MRAADGVDSPYRAVVAISFPRQYARTQRFTLGRPRNVTVAGDGRHVVFLRSRGGTDPITCLWSLDVETGVEILVADPLELATGPIADDLPDEERARRERLREGAAGITSFALDAGGRIGAFALGGRLGVAEIARPGSAVLLDVDGSVTDPRPDPTGRRIAYVSGSALRMVELDGLSVTATSEIAAEETETVTWGSADFIAAEEMHRLSGYWWSPEGTQLAVCRVDTAPVEVWYLADPATPATPARPLRYPAAGTANARTDLWVIDVADPSRRARVDLAGDDWPYLADVRWNAAGLIATVQDRTQTRLEIRRVDLPTEPAAMSSTAMTETAMTGTAMTGTAITSTAIATDHDPHWVELVPGVPRLLSDGRLLSAADRDGARRLCLDGRPITPPELQVRAVLGLGGPENDPYALITANHLDDATATGVYEVSFGDLDADADAGGHRAGGRVRPLGGTDAAGIHHAVVAGETAVVATATMATTDTRQEIWRAGRPTGTVLTDLSETPVLEPRVEILTTTERRLATAVVLPTDHDGSPLPVLLDPYGGPHAQRVVRSLVAYTSAQWFADQGFAVVITDGRGTPGRGSAWERAVHHDLAGPVLDDQIDALDDVAARLGVLDLDRVAIRGWSFGGYLAALAVLHRPDRIHAAIAGAPVTDWRLYDTHYTERYLGNPSTDPEPYERTSLVAAAHQLERPLLIIHGFADDNVVAAHSAQLSRALLAAGRPHEVLYLSGVSHMTPQDVVAENLLVHQLDFLRRHIGRPVDDR